MKENSEYFNFLRVGYKLASIFWKDFHLIVSFSLFLLIDIYSKFCDNINVRDWGNRNMIQGKISLTPQDILEKDFKIDTRGYRLKEVDQFLDEIIGDYEQFYDIIKNLETEKENLHKEIMNLKQELRNAKMNIDIAKNEDKEITNLDIIRRVSNLEKIVYGKVEKGETD